MAQEKLFIAAAKNDCKLAEEALSDKTIDIDATDTKAQTALLIAVTNRHLAVAEFLLNNHADPNIGNSVVGSPLSCALKNKNQPMIELLLRFGANESEHSLIDSAISKRQPSSLVRGSSVSHGNLVNIEYDDYHAEFLALRDNIRMLHGEENVITQAYFQLQSLILKLPVEWQGNMEKLRTRLISPEELLKFDGYLKAKKNHPDTINIKNSEIRAQIAVTELKPESTLFTVINKLLDDISKTLENFRKYDSEEIGAIRTLLSRVIESYTQYRDNICQSRNEERLSLCEGLVRIRSSLGFYYMNSGAAQRFMPFFAPDEEAEYTSNMPQKDNRFGTHAVLQLYDTFFKVRPTAPGKEHAFDSLNKIVTGQGSAPTELLILERRERTFPVLASKAVRGEIFLELLSNRPQLLSKLDGFNYSGHVITSLLAVPADGKPDNYMALIENNKLGEVDSIKIVGIDNDLVFGDPIIKFPKPPYQHDIELKSVFFCMQQMQDKINPIFRRSFLQLPAELVILKWLRELLQQEAHYMHYQTTSIGESQASALQEARVLFSQQEFKDVNLPVRFLPGTVSKIYERILRIQQLFREQPQLTHQELLNEIFPAIGVGYEHIRAINKGNILDAVTYLYAKCPHLEIICESRPDMVSSLSKYHRTMTDQENDMTESVSSACQNFINQLNYADLPDVYVQGYVLEHIITDFAFLTELTIRNCDALHDERLESLAGNLLGLRTLTLINCQNIRGYGLSALLRAHPNINITLDTVSNFSSKTLLNLLLRCSSLTFVLPTGVYSSKSDAEALLNAAVSAQLNNLVTALLLYGSQSYTKNQTQTSLVLHQACRLGITEVIHNLLACQVPINLRDSSGDTALDICIKKSNQGSQTSKKASYLNINNILLLLEHGALDCKDPNTVAQLLLSHSSLIFKRKAQLRTPLYNFVCSYNLLTPALVPLLISHKTSRLILASPRHLRLTHFTLSVDIIIAIASHLKHIHSLDIAGSIGLTPELLVEILKLPLKALYIDFDQAVSCKLASIENINEAVDIKRDNTTISIIHLNLNAKRFDQNQLLRLTTFIRKSTRLEILELSRCSLDESAGRILAGCLQSNVTLKRLVINTNPLGDAGVALIVKALLNKERLQQLHLEETGAALETTKVLAQLLQASRTLEELMLYSNPLGNDGVKTLADEGLQDKSRAATSRRQVLKRLNLNQTGMASEGAIALANALQLLKTVEFVDVGYNPDIKHGIQAFIKLLHLNQIKDFRADNIGGGEEAVTKLNEIVQRNRQHQHVLALEQTSGRSQSFPIQRVNNFMPPEYGPVRQLSSLASNPSSFFAGSTPRQVSHPISSSLDGSPASAAILPKIGY